MLSCYCLSEPQAGSDALAARTRAVLSPDGKNWILNGQKMWITNGGFADVYIVFAKVDGEKFSCFIVERGTPGFSVGAEEKKMGIRGSSTVPLFFENAPVPKENLLHEIGRGHIVAFNTLNVGRFSLGAYCLGGAKKVLESLVEIFEGAHRVRQIDRGVRPDQGQAGRDGHPHLRGRIDDLPLGGHDRSGRFVAHGGADKTKQAMQVLEEYAIESSISKVVGSETLDYCVDEGVQIFGGYGFHEDYPVARAYRDSRINRIFEGTNEINRMLIIQMLMKRAMAGILPLIPAAMKLGEEVLAGPSFEEAPHGRVCRGRALAGAGEEDISARSRQRPCRNSARSLAEQQEIVASLANIVMDVYAMESSLRRAQKAFAKRGESASRHGRCRARVYLRRDGPHRKGSAHRAGRLGRRRHAHHATRRSAPIRQARSARYDRDSPPRCRRRPRAGSLSIRGPISVA